MAKKRSQHNASFGSHSGEQPISIPPMTRDEKEEMLCQLIRSPDAFVRAKDKLKSWHFDQRVEADLSLVWDVTCEIWRKHGRLPTKDMMLTRLAARIDNEPDLLVEAAREELQHFVNWTYALQEDGILASLALEHLERFLTERLSVNVRDAFEMLGNDVPLHLPKLITNLNQQFGQISSLRADSARSVPDAYKPRPLALRSTNIGFLDTFLGGGQFPGEVYGLLGPTGVGKTTLALQIAIEGAKAARDEYAKRGSTGSRGAWFFLSYEAPVDPELYNRSLIYSAGLDRNRLASGWDALSTSENLEPYERETQKEAIKQGLPVLGERERLAAAQTWLSRHLYFIDMTGGADKQSCGAGGVPEIAGIVEWEARRLGVVVEGIVVDYVGEAVDRLLALNGLPYTEKRNYMQQFVSEAVRLLAGPLRCPVWLVHQLAGAVQNRSALTPAHHNEAGECKSFANPLWFSFQLGTKCIVDGIETCLLSCTKQRRAGAHPPHLLEIQGKFGRLVSAEDRYRVDWNSKRIVPADEHSEVSETEVKPQYRNRKQAPPAGDQTIF